MMTAEKKEDDLQKLCDQQISLVEASGESRLNTLMDQIKSRFYSVLNTAKVCFVSFTQFIFNYQSPVSNDQNFFA